MSIDPSASKPTRRRPASGWSTFVRYAFAAGFGVGAYVIYTYVTNSKDGRGSSTPSATDTTGQHITLGWPMNSNTADTSMLGASASALSVAARSGEWSGEVEDLCDDDLVAVDESEKRQMREVIETSMEQAQNELLRQRRFGSVLQNALLTSSGAVEKYFHFELDSLSPELERFAQVKFLLIMQSKKEVLQCLERLEQEFPTWFRTASFDPFEAIGGSSHFFLAQVGPVALVSAGIGAPTMSILLQEITKLLVDAGAFNTEEDNDAFEFDTSYVDYVLLGAVAGIGIGPSLPSVKRRSSMASIGRTERGGIHSRARSVDFAFSADSHSRKSSMGRMPLHAYDTEEKRQAPTIRSGGLIPVILPSDCVNEKLRSRQCVISCGDRKERRSQFNHTLQKALKSSFTRRELQPKTGKVLSVQFADEALALSTSTVVSQPENIRRDYLKSCMDARVRCVDLQSGTLASFCQKLHLSAAAVLSVTRDVTMDGSPKQVRVSKGKAMEASMDVVCRYIYERLFSAHALEQQKKLQSRMQTLTDKGFGNTPGGPSPPQRPISPELKRPARFTSLEGEGQPQAMYRAKSLE